MGRSRTYFGRRYCYSLRKRKNGSNYLPGVSWPSARKLVSGLKVSEIFTVIRGQKVLCGWIPSWLCCLPTLLNLSFSLCYFLFTFSPFLFFSSATYLLPASLLGCQDLFFSSHILTPFQGRWKYFTSAFSSVGKLKLASVHQRWHFLTCRLHFLTHIVEKHINRQACP